MARKETRASRRPADTPERKGKGGGMLSGLVIGLILGLVVAAGLAWYFNLGSSDIKPVDSAPKAESPDIKPDRQTDKGRGKASDPLADNATGNAAGSGIPGQPDLEKTPVTAPETRSGKPPAADTPPPAKPRVDYTFYGILPGEKPAKPLEPPKSNEIWWLQVAALKSPADADKLRARLTLLNLHVSTQKVDSAGQPLYRVRVGPYKREDDAFGDLDVLAQNNFEPRLLKEPVTP